MHSDHTARRAGAQDATALGPMPVRLRRRPKQERGSYLKAELAEQSIAGRGVHKLSQIDLAAELEVQQSFVSRCERAHEPHAPSVLHIASAPPLARAWAQTLIRWQAAKQAMHALVARIVHGSDHEARLSALREESGDLVRAYERALSNRVLEDHELDEIEREALEEIEAELEVVTWIRAERARRRAVRAGGQ